AGGNRQRPQPPPLFSEADGGDDARRPTRPLGVHRAQPVGELLLEISAIVEVPAREEALLAPADEIRDGALLLPGARPAQLGREPVIEGDLAKHGVPDDQLALAGEDDGLGIVPDRDEGHAAERLEGLTTPKSCWLNSPATPSKRTSGATDTGRRRRTSS